MSLSLTPKFWRNVSRIIPFGLIWLAASKVFLINDWSLTRNQNPNSDTDIELTVPVVIFANIAIVCIGLLVGTFELVVLERRFVRYSLVRKIFIKFVIYVTLLLLIISVVYPVAVAMEAGVSITDQAVWDKTMRFFGSMTFVNTAVQLSVSLLLSVLYAAISENLGHNVLRNLFTGRYHRPVVEDRIFMFLDMKDSTAIAEKLGHMRYFQLLQEYYDLMSDPIINTHGEVYQYIGDEVVITWKSDRGVESDQCITCFEQIKERFAKAGSHFQEKYGVVPDFKAGIHLGEVTTGEMGALKREIVFTGDALNTAARIQSLCKQYARDLIISDELMYKLDASVHSFEKLDEITLKGKSKPTVLYALAPNDN